MAAFGLTEAVGLVALLVVIIGLAVIAREAVHSLRWRRQSARAMRKIDDYEEREELNRLRLRDLDAWAKGLNARRTRFGGKAVPLEELREHQFDPTYQADLVKVDRASLRRVRSALKEAAENGEAPLLEEPIEET